jgi:uncharacterized protein YndB with AHSA1/START domain
MEIVRSLIIGRPIEELFDYLSDARNDPEWCPKVLSSDQVEGDGPGLGATYAVVHKPIPGRSARTMRMTCQDWQRPRRLEWYEEDGRDSVRVTYTLDDLGGSTRLTQTSIAALSTPCVLAPIMRRGIGHDIARQLSSLKKRLERG